MIDAIFPVADSFRVRQLVMGKKLALNIWLLERPFEAYRTSLK